MKEIIQIGKYIFIIFLVWSHFFSSPIVYSQNLTPDEEYQFIIEKIKNREDTDVDYTSLRMLYTQTSWYKADSKERDENILKMAQAWVDQRYDEAIQLGNRLLEEEYLNPFVHDLLAKI